MPYLLDTDWMIHCLNGVERFANRVDELESDGLRLSIISLAEVFEGVFGSRDPPTREAELNTFLIRLDVVSIDIETARIFANQRRRLRAEGLMIGDMDLLIAATAIRHDLTLLTNNRRHFERLPNLTVESL